MKKSKYYFAIIFLYLNLTLANANPNENIKNCSLSPDETGCLLHIAKIKALKINDVNEQAEALGGLLRTTGELHRSDFELISRSFQILQNKKLDLEHYLDLQISIATYFNKRDLKKSKLHIEQAIKVFNKAVERDDPKERMMLTTWACGLIDENSNIWKNVSHVTAEHCIPNPTPSIAKNNEFDLDDIVITMLAAWVQSDFKELESSKVILENKISSLEEYGIKNSKKSIGIETQKIKILLYTSQTDMYRRSGLRQQSIQAMTQAKEALIGLEKLTNTIEAIESRLALANAFNKMYDFEEAISSLRPIADIFTDAKKIKKVPLKFQVEYLVTLADALDRGGLRTYNEIKLSNNDTNSPPK